MEQPEQQQVKMKQPHSQQQQQQPLQPPPQYHEINLYQGIPLQQQLTTTYPKQQYAYITQSDQTNYDYGQSLNEALLNPIMEQPEPQQVKMKIVK